MTPNEQLLKDADMEAIAKKGGEVYERIKDQYLAGHKGEFLAIDPGSEEVFLAASSGEAVAKARERYPNTIFYVVRIGYSVAEELASMGIYAERVH